MEKEKVVKRPKIVCAFRARRFVLKIKPNSHLKLWSKFVKFEFIFQYIVYACIIKKYTCISFHKYIKPKSNSKIIC
jgi:hypothetical protein